MSATGMEMVVSNLIRMLGIKPEHLMEPLKDMADRIKSFDARLAKIEADQAEIKHMLRHLSAPVNTMEQINGTRSERHV